LVAVTLDVVVLVFALVAVALGVVVLVFALVAVALHVVALVLTLEAVALGVIDLFGGEILLGHGAPPVVRCLGLACRTAAEPSVVWLTPELSACRHIGAGEAAQRVRLFHGHGPVLHLDPAAPLEAAQRRVDALPGAPGLMRQFLLAQPEPDDAVVTPGLA